jgi:asparagine synthase (glutamine-hydrolysing)
MCGILGIFGSSLSPVDLKKKLIDSSRKIRHRGPDWSGYLVENGNGIAHERLAIIDPESGTQPLISNDGNLVVAANGEVYNYKELFVSEAKDYTPQTGSDSEVIIPLYQKFGHAFPNMLRGMFSFIIYDRRDGQFVAVRDHVGITPLYFGHAPDGSTWVGSEMKTLSAECTDIKQFPPGHLYDSRTEEFTKWWNPSWMNPETPIKNACDLTVLRESFIRAVKRRMMSDVPWGVLLSGGLDSSLVASVAQRIIKRSPDKEYQWAPKLHSFCVGLKNSPDIKAAQQVADAIGTIHHSYTYTLEEGLNTVREVIYHLETYDVTTIRAATPMFLMSRKIKAMGIKMVLSGEGADEIFGGYLYFHKAPNAGEFQAELRDKISNLFMFDCLRANKATSAWGLEARVPFLDRDFLDVAMNIDANEKMIRKDQGRIEKHILRAAFDTPDDPFLPSEILWRQKEQFSDGVGYGWIDSLRDLAEERVTDEQFKHRAHRFPHNTPVTKEAYMYRTMFEEHYPNPAAVHTVPGGPSIACSTARAIAWDASFQNRADCSGRAVAGVHDEAYDEQFRITSKTEK